MIFAFFIFATPIRALPPEIGYRPKGSRHLGTFSGAFARSAIKTQKMRPHIKAIVDLWP